MSESKLVLNQKLLNSFARNSPSITHLRKYPKVSQGIDYVFSIPVVSTIINLFLSSVWKVSKWCIESPESPTLIKRISNYVVGVLSTLDSLFNLLVLREGLDAFVSMWDSHSQRPGIWIIWFGIDYIANGLNILLKQLVVEPFHLTKAIPNQTSNPDPQLDTVIDKSKPHNIDVSENSSTIGNEELSLRNLPHVNELTATTRSVSKELQDKLQSNEVLSQTKTKMNDHFDSYVKPTYNNVKEIYQDKYNKSESVPQAVLTTGLEIGSTTLKNFKTSSKWSTPTSSNQASPVSDKNSLINARKQLDEISANTTIEDIAQQVKEIPNPLVDTTTVNATTTNFTTVSGTPKNLETPSNGSTATNSIPNSAGKKKNDKSKGK